MADYFLQILSGVQVGRKVKLGQSISLGRNPENTICFSGPDGTLVSGRHAVIERRGEQVILRDVGSTNGTYVDGEPVTEVALGPEEVFSLGVSGPKLRLVNLVPGGGDPGLRSASGATHLKPGDSRSSRTEFDPRKAGRDDAGKDAGKRRGGDGEPGGGRRGRPPAGGSRPGGFGGDVGDYTMGLAQRLKDDEAGNHEFQELIRDQGRAERIAKSGMLSKRDAMMIKGAAETYSKSKVRNRIILIAVVSVATLVVSVLLYQNLGYRGKLKQQAKLVSNVQDLESRLAEARKGAPAGPAGVDHEKEVLVAKLRAAERQLMNVRGGLRSSDLINTYKNPLGREIHTILEGFGKRDYIVPEIFIKQVEKHIYTFTKTSTRNVMVRSFANKDRHYRLIESELMRQGMPLAFLYLAMHESLLDSAIISSAGARGLWQFMPQTAREYGLRVPVNWRDLPVDEDERTNPRLATQAGVKYVKTLYAEFGDVALAMAAYNAGEGRIRKALRSIDDPINNRDFWYIYRLGILAAETNEYVPKIIATMIVDKNRARYGF
jgi:hypothetical protein